MRGPEEDNERKEDKDDSYGQEGAIGKWLGSVFKKVGERGQRRAGRSGLVGVGRRGRGHLEVERERKRCGWGRRNREVRSDGGGRDDTVLVRANMWELGQEMIELGLKT